MPTIDVFSSKPHVRHIVREELSDGSVVTACGRRTSRYWKADNTSYTYPDGSVYARKCKICYAQTWQDEAC